MSLPESGVLETATGSQTLDEVDGRATRTVRFIIEEGPRTTVKRLRIRGNRHLTDDQVMDNILTRQRQGFDSGVFSPERLETDVRAVQLFYARQGFLAAEVRSATDFNPQRDQVTVDIEIDEGVRTRVAEIAFAGLGAVDRETALNALELKIGEPYAEHLLRGDETTLHVLHPGDLAGELGFIDGTAHSAGVRALTPAQVVTLERSKFESLIESHPKVLYDVMRVIIRRVHATLRRMNFQYVEMTNYITKTLGRY